MFKGVQVGGNEKQQQKEKDVNVAPQRQRFQRRNSILGGSIFEDAKKFMSFGRVFRFVTWLYSERKMILLCCSHFVATMVIWGECTFLSIVLPIQGRSVSYYLVLT